MGKTALVYRYSKNDFNEKYLITIGVEYGNIKMKHKGIPISLRIWDTVKRN